MACDISGADGSTKFSYDRILNMGLSASLRLLSLCCRGTHEKDSSNLLCVKVVFGVYFFEGSIMVLSESDQPASCYVTSHLRSSTP